MEETRRYHTPKPIREYMKDMQLDSASIQRQIKIQESSRKFADDTLQVLEKYMVVMDELHPLYEEASKIIQDIDLFYTQTRS